MKNFAEKCDELSDIILSELRRFGLAPPEAATVMIDGLSKLMAANRSVTRKEESMQITTEMLSEFYDLHAAAGIEPDSPEASPIAGLEVKSLSVDSPMVVKFVCGDLIIETHDVSPSKGMRFELSPPKGYAFDKSKTPKFSNGAIIVECVALQ